MCAPDISGARDGLSARKLAHKKGQNYSLVHQNTNRKLSELAHTERYGEYCTVVCGQTDFVFVSTSL